MRVLLISHTCQSATEGQPKCAELAKYEDMELRVLVPAFWKHYGKWRSPEIPKFSRFKLEIGKVRLPWVGPAQYYMHWHPGLRKLCEDFRPDVIDLWEEPWGLVSAQACWIRNRYFPKTRIISETEQNINKKLPLPFEWCRSYVMRNADYVVARSAEALSVVRRKGYTGPGAVVPNAVDNSLFRRLDRISCRASTGVRGFVVGYAGRLVQEKGLTDLIAVLSACTSDVNLVIIGDGPMRTHLLTMIDELNLRNRVRLIPALRLEQLPIFFNAMDVLVLPSWTTERWKEQFGRVIIEAHACGIPVIGSSSGAIPEVVGEGGIVVPERNPASLASAIMRLHQDQSMRAKMGAAGVRAVDEKFTWERIAHRMHGIYEELINDEGASKPSEHMESLVNY